jgi:hypothetical protein
MRELTALEGCDFEKHSGRITFRHGEMQKAINIKVVAALHATSDGDGAVRIYMQGAFFLFQIPSRADDRLQDEKFEVFLQNPAGGAKFEVVSSTGDRDDVVVTQDACEVMIKVTDCCLPVSLAL